MQGASPDKAEWRRRLRNTLRDSAVQASWDSSCIVDRLRGLLQAAGVMALAAFMPFGHEPDIRPLLEEWLSAGTHRLLLPVYDSDRGSYGLSRVTDLSRELVSGRHGIPEPLPSLPRSFPPFTFDVPLIWLVPALAFDRSGNRLGRGGGFYDRLLEGGTGLKIGVAHDVQLVEALPVSSHDVRMDYVITESQCVCCG